MSYRTLLGAAVLCVCSAGLAAETDRVGYLALGAGYGIADGEGDASDQFFSDVDIDLDDGYDVSAAAGMYLEPFRLELQYASQWNDTTFLLNDVVEEEGDLWANLFMLNAYWDITVAERTCLYLGAGVGLLYCEIENDAPFLTVPLPDDDGTAFAYQAMIGVAYELTQQLTLTGGYRGWSADEVDLDKGELNLPWIHMLEVGLRFSF